MSEHIMIPLKPYTEPQRRWVEQTKALVKRYLDSAYEPNESSNRGVDSMFIHIAADVVWLSHPDAPSWGQLDVQELVTRLAEAPHWDDTWLLHALATLSTFYGWLARQQDIALDRPAVRAIESELEAQMVDCLHSLGMPGLTPLMD